MPANIDELQIEINANATKANQAIDRLVTKLNGLSALLSKLNTSSLTGLANGVNRLGSAMQTMNTVKTSDFTRLANNVQKLGNINVQSLNSAASSMSHLTRAFNNLGSVSANAMQVGELAKNISRLGNASVQRAITNIPQLATSLNQLMATLSRAPRVSSNVIQMTQALANLASQGSRVGSASRSMVTGLANTRTAMTRTTKSTFSLAAAFGRFYANYFLVIRGIKRFVSAITGTSNYIEAFNYYTVAMGKIASKWDKDWETYGDELGKTFSNKFIETTNETFSKLSGVKLDLSADFKTGILSETGMKNLGLNIKEVTQYAAQLASMMDSVGQSGETTLATTNAMVKLAGDISSLYNIKYSDAAKNIQSVLMGQSRAGYKFGWDTTMASLQSVADKFNLSKPVSEMAQFEKQQLRILTILEQSKVAYGDLANTIDSPSNMIRQFKNNLSEAGMVLGQLFIPLLQKVLPVLNGVLKAFTRLFESIAGFFNIKLDFSKYGQGYSEVEEGIDGITDSLDGMAESAEKAKAGVRGFDELKTISSPKSSSGSGGASGGAIDLTDEILKATEEYNKIWEEAYNKMEDRVGKFADKVEKSLEPIKKLFKDLSIGDYFAVGEDVSTIVSGINNYFARAIERVNWQKVGKNIGDFMAGINWTQILSSFGRLFWDGVNGAIDMWKGSFKAAPIETVLLTTLLGLKFTGVGKLIGAKLVASITKHISFKSVVNVFMAGFKGLFGSGAATSALAFMDKLAVGFTGIASIIAGVTMSISNFIEMFKNGFNLINEILMVVGITLTAIGAIILGAPATVAALVAGIVAAVGTIVVIVKDNWEFIKEFFSGIGEWFSTYVIQPVVDVFKGMWKSISGFFVNLWEDIKSVWNVVSNWFSTYVIEPVVSFFQGFFTRVSQIFEGLWIIVQAIWIITSTWFSENVIEPIVKFFKGMFNIVGGIFSSLWEGIKNVWNTVSTWFSEKVITPIIDVFSPIVSKIGDFFTSLWSNIKDVWFTASKWFDENIITPFKNAWSTAIEAIKGFFTGLWDSIKSGLAGAMNAVIGGIESGINFIIDGINKIIGGFNKIVSWASKVAEVDWGGVDLIPEVSIARIPGYETGGFPKQYSLFMAGENGIPEIAGTVGGRPAVAGGAEITGIRDAIYSTSMQEMQLIREQNALLRGILDKEFGISTDAVFRSVKTSASDYTRRTGKPAFN